MIGRAGAILFAPAPTDKPEWWNGRHGGLKSRWASSPVKVRLLSPAPNFFTEKCIERRRREGLVALKLTFS
jgi:hypothetical protein